MSAGCSHCIDLCHSCFYQPVSFPTKMKMSTVAVSFTELNSTADSPLFINSNLESYLMETHTHRIMCKCAMQQVIHQ